MSKPNPQSNSPFVKLPREVRDAIYLEVWRLTGLRQHIVVHWGGKDNNKPPESENAKPPESNAQPSSSTAKSPDANATPPEPKDAKPHYCRWKCCTEFEVEDRLQEEVEQFRIKQGVELGGWFPFHPASARLDYQGLLSSPWDNHWKCWVEITEKYGREYNDGSWVRPRPGHVVSTSGCRCWKDVAKDADNMKPLWDRGSKPPPLKPLSRWKRAVEKVKKVKDAIRPPPPPPPEPEPAWTGSPYMPLLLCCKVLSPEIVESLYRSTTFIFTDLVAWQFWLGYCKPHPEHSERPKLAGAPQAFLEHTKSIELCLHPSFRFEVPCAAPRLGTDPSQLHDLYDFHWLNLDRLQNLRSLKIWMSARTLSIFPKQPPALWGDHRSDQWRSHRIDQFDMNELRKTLSCFDNLDEFIISTPLAEYIGPEDGYVQDVMTKPNHQVWKRGTGDRFHPMMNIDLGCGGPISQILSSHDRTVNPTTEQLSFSYSFRLSAI
ncbi:hypothetical protein CDV36_002301 [Fusarium kuroshium]|uniref:Uncharacterized protein n=1 Tax=Fusarium kuroshium TaxID=2010991 RepID=A0A3M2SKG7_9HYPO|nr:hypothetical protein CDV36_002301 [Fusarium kuroshium]